MQSCDDSSPDLRAACPMKRPRLVIGILVGVNVALAALVLWRIARLTPDNDTPFDWLLFMVVPSQGNLVGIWTALGGKRTPWRAVVTVVCVVVGLRLAHGLGYSFALGEVACLSAWQILGVSSVLLLARLAGLRLIHCETEWPKEELGRFQFSIWQMLVWTFILAVILSSVHYLPQGIRPGFYATPYEAISEGSLTCIALASMWLAFGRAWLPARILLEGMTLGLGVVLGHSVEGFPWINDCVLLSTGAIMTIASLLVVRWAGYRLTWR